MDAEKPAPTLPSIYILFEESWHLFKKSLLQLFIINIITFIINVVLFVLAAGFIFLFLLPSGSSILFAAIITFAIMLLPACFVAIIQEIATILILDSKGEKPFAAILRKSFSFFIPVLIIDLITSILVLGGFFLLILPAILLYFFFFFTTYEVILNNQKTTGALANSYSMVKKHFGEIFVRILLIGIIAIFLELFSDFIPKSALGLKAVVSSIMFFVNLFFGWFLSAYFFTLYKQTRVVFDATKSVTSLDEKPQLKQIYILSAIGWVIGIVLLIGTFFLMVNLSKSPEFWKLLNYYQKIYKNKSIHAPQNIPTIRNSLISIIPTPIMKTFISQNLGIRFNYSSNDGNFICTYETGNKVYLYYCSLPTPDMNNPNNGQFVQVLSKNTSDTLATAVEKQFLQGSSAQTCLTKQNSIGTLITISPQLPVLLHSPHTDCPAYLSRLARFSYFLMDTQYPEKFLFIKEDGGIFPAGNEGVWSSTIKIFK